MSNVEITKIDNDWKATGDTKYYWPNDPRTTIDFYAYSPANGTVNTTGTYANHQKILTGVVAHSEEEGLKLNNYVHNNAYVDFMVADPVRDATYTNQTVDSKNGCVALSFGHKMTQVNFNVKIADEALYPNVDFTIHSITLNNILCGATYSYANETDGEDNTKAWVTTDQKASYRIYPATTLTNLGTDAEPVNNMNDAPALVNVDNNETTEVTVVLETDNAAVSSKSKPGRSFSTTPVTMIPQALTASVASDDPASVVNGQSFTVVYTISGTGVATETVEKTFDFAAATMASGQTAAWDINKKITYTLTISLNEITFAPTVETWEEATGSYGI